MRRIYTPKVQAGDIPLAADEAHHARHVLRLKEGAEVEIFDDEGTMARGVLSLGVNGGVIVRVESMDKEAAGTIVPSFQWTIASAIPKGERADWMIEKLSELGVSSFIPLAAARSVVLPEGKNKRERWIRLAIESAKQSRRRGVMRIEKLMSVGEVIDRIRGSGVGDRGSDGISDRSPTPDPRPPIPGIYFSTDPSAMPIADLLQGPAPDSLMLLIGPEGDWTEQEHIDFKNAGLTGVSLMTTILRVETAAVAAAAIVGSILVPRLSPAAKSVDSKKERT